MPFLICQKIIIVPQITKTRIIQLDRKDVKVKGELKDVLIRLSSNPRVHHTIDIVVVYITESYNFLLSRDCSTKLQGYFSIDWSHLWLPHKGKENQICVSSEAHMKHTVTKLEGKNEPISFDHSILGNYFFETYYDFYETQTSKIPSKLQSVLRP
jgi:hypothetical protein